jgi:hypothetical protein
MNITFDQVFDLNKRYQKGLSLNELFPKIDGLCACGCNTPLTGRQSKWASRECNDKLYNQFAILKGNTSAIRKALFEIEGGFCRSCGVFDEYWEADHIIPVHRGGGWCGLENFQTLCPYCHYIKTQNQISSHREAISSQETSSSFRLLTKAVGEEA